MGATVKKILLNLILIVIFCAVLGATRVSSDTEKTGTGLSYLRADDPASLSDPSPVAPPAHPVKLIFIHHSSGENWLKDTNGGLGVALMNNNYFVSDTNYGWGPISFADAAPAGSYTDPGTYWRWIWGILSRSGSTPIGSYTDIGHLWMWFRGPKSSEIVSAVLNESGQHSSYSRLGNDPGGRNRIVMVKSCYPNSNLKGNPDNVVPSIDSNPLKGRDSNSEYLTVANAKGIYIDLLSSFGQHQDTLFIVITAPPVSDGKFAGNARAFNQWLVSDWLKTYPYKNVVVFDFYNVLTSNGGNASINDLGEGGGNHHHWWNESIQHIVNTTGGLANTTAYATAPGDDHPSKAGNQKATAEFVPLLNFAYNRWQNG
jgi:hypothetical protein